MLKDEGLHNIDKNRDRLDLAFDIFFAVVAVFVLSLGFYYWLRLVGVWEIENWRFDLMGWHWRVLAASMAVFYPVAACGLWQQERWGIILWLGGGVSETLCFTLFAASFNFNLFVPLLHLVLLFCYIFLSLWRYHAMKQEKDSITHY